MPPFDVTLLLPTYHRHLPVLRRTLPLFRSLYPWIRILVQLGDWPAPTEEMREFLNGERLDYRVTDWEETGFSSPEIEHRLRHSPAQVELRRTLPYLQGIRKIKTEFFYSCDTDAVPPLWEGDPVVHWVDLSCRLLRERSDVLAVRPLEPYHRGRPGDRGEDEDFSYYSTFGSGCFLGRTQEFQTLDLTQWPGAYYSDLFRYEALVSKAMVDRGQIFARLRRASFDGFGMSVEEDLETPEAQARLTEYLRAYGWSD